LNLGGFTFFLDGFNKPSGNPDDDSELLQANAVRRFIYRYERENFLMIGCDEDLDLMKEFPDHCRVMVESRGGGVEFNQRFSGL